MTDPPPDPIRRLEGPSREWGLILGGALLEIMLNFCRTRSLEKPRLRLDVLKGASDDDILALAGLGKLRVLVLEEWL